LGRVKESLSAEEIILSKDSDEQIKWRYGDEREKGEDGIGEVTAVVGEEVAEDGIIVQGFTVKI
jgi:hypothetical protein